MHTKKALLKRKQFLARIKKKKTLKLQKQKQKQKT